MKKVEVKNIALSSVFWLFSGMFLIIGFVMALFGIGGERIRASLQTIPFVGSLLTGFLGALILGILCGVCAGLYFSLLAAIYNVFAMILGGIKCEIEEK